MWLCLLEDVLAIDEIYNHVPFAKILLAHLTNTILPGFRGGKVCQSELVDVFRNFEKDRFLRLRAIALALRVLIVRFRRLGLEMPLGDKSIRRQTLMQAATGISVDVLLVLPDDHAQLM